VWLEHQKVLNFSHIGRMRNVSCKSDDNFERNLPATGDSFLITHHRDFH
jgi:hypothetical protein